jgi:hypothetical protein
MEPTSFRELFCTRFGCLPDAFEKRAFGTLLYGHAKIIGAILRRLKPEMFADDFKFIRDLGQATDLREANISAADFQDGNLARRRFFRVKLKIRVSGGKASELARELFLQHSLNAQRSQKA